MTITPETRGILAALSDQNRVSILDALALSPSSILLLSRELPITRQATTKHLAVLEAAGLVRSQRIGRQVVFEAVTEPLTTSVVDLSAAVSRWSQRLDALKRAAEAPSD